MLKAILSNFSNKNRSPKLLKFEENLIQERGWFMIICLTSPVIFGFMIIDYFLRPEVFQQAFIIRSTFLCMALFYHFAVKKKYFDVQKLHIFYSILIGFEVGFIVKLSGYESSMTMRGLILPVIGSLAFMPWTPKAMILTTLGFVAPTFLFIFFKPGAIDTSTLVTHLCFLLATFFVCISMFFSNRRSREREFLAKQALDDLNKKKDKIIEEQTARSVKLTKLSQQFSTKTIDAVMSGHMDLDKIAERNITCIFLDIGESTYKANTLDFKVYLSLIDEFINKSCEIFMKHDITVSTFLGDGLMAFGNAPLDTTNHLEKSLAACLEILEMREKFEEDVYEKWQSSFNIRLGVTSGPAFCGFYPSGTKGVYSATGRSINLSSRLCNLGYTNMICLPKELAETLENSKHNQKFSNITLKERRNIKGFEEENLNLALILPKQVKDKFIFEDRFCRKCYFENRQHCESNDQNLSAA